jgi:glycosyltransferase involved in cell wall biosynthesis
VKKVLFLIRSLAYSGPARRLTLLAPRLPRAGFEVRVAALGPPAPWIQALRQQGIPVEALGLRRRFDVRPFLALQALAREFCPDIIHAWGTVALRAAFCLPGVRQGRPVFASAALPPAGKLSPFDHLLLRQATGVLAFGEGEKRAYLRAGLDPGRVTTGPPAVAECTQDANVEAVPHLPGGGRVLLAAGPIVNHKGLYEAVWGFDTLRHVYDDLHLVVAGEGQDTSRLADFARCLGASRRVHFTGPCPSLAPLLQRADLVWVPSLADTGRSVAAEAMLAGRPVVASRWPGLSEVVEDGVTGYLVTPGDKAALARQTWSLLDDPCLRRNLGEAGRRRAAERFGVNALVAACVPLYEGAAAAPSAGRA